MQHSFCKLIQHKMSGIAHPPKSWSYDVFQGEIITMKETDQIQPLLDMNFVFDKGYFYRALTGSALDFYYEIRGGAILYDVILKLSRWCHIYFEKTRCDSTRNTEKKVQK